MRTNSSTRKNFCQLFLLTFNSGAIIVPDMAAKRKPKQYRYDRIQFAYKPGDISVLDKLCEKFGNVDRQAILRIALKRLAEAEGVRA